jgi:hypothetical protein
MVQAHRKYSSELRFLEIVLPLVGRANKKMKVVDLISPTFLPSHEGMH